MCEGADVPARESDVTAAISRVDQVGRQIFASVETLFKKLEPVLRPSTRPENKKEAPDEPSGVPMACRLHAIACALGRAQAKLDVLLETIEV